MENWGKLQRGEVYNDFSEDLFVRRIRAKKLFRAYNQTRDEDVEERYKLLSELFKDVGQSVWIEPDFRCEYGSNISIGNQVYINFGCVILDCAAVTIGNSVLMGPNVGIYALNHALHPEERQQGSCQGKRVRIEDNVWLGGDVKILAGVTIGKGSVIGTGSIVTKDIPPNVIAAGNPCRIIREITEEDKTGYKPR